MNDLRAAPLRALVVAVVVLIGANVAALNTSAASDELTLQLGGAASQALGEAEFVPSDPTLQIDVDPVADIVLSSDTDGDLPIPEPSPLDPYAPTPLIEHGVLEIPRIGVSQTLFEGVTLTAINRGPSHWPGTAMPGELGNVVVAGHRTTYSRPFWDLDQLTVGDELIFRLPAATHVYELTAIEVVQPEGLHIVDQTRAHTATLFACHPKGSARQRIVGHFELTESTPTDNPFGSEQN